ncbi:hypothetical protein NT05HA_1112 [Aggregatibacter aphrophilus NJ8700]|nr:hypothetical protein NT05HA_1112 [Aggregatibacter aphrophilus NJ8700]
MRKLCIIAISAFKNNKKMSANYEQILPKNTELFYPPKSVFCKCG